MTHGNFISLHNSEAIKSWDVCATIQFHNTAHQMILGFLMAQNWNPNTGTGAGRKDTYNAAHIPFYLYIV